MVSFSIANILHIISETFRVVDMLKTRNGLHILQVHRTNG